MAWGKEHKFLIQPDLGLDFTCHLDIFLCLWAKDLSSVSLKFTDLQNRTVMGFK